MDRDTIPFRGEFRGEEWVNPWGDMGGRLPGAEIQVGKELAQLKFGFDPKLLQHAAQVRFNRLRRKVQLDGNLLVGVTQAGQGRNILLAR